MQRVRWRAHGGGDGGLKLTHWCKPIRGGRSHVQSVHTETDSHRLRTRATTQNTWMHRVLLLISKASTTPGLTGLNTGAEAGDIRCEEKFKTR